jgi:hypothetical protein
VRVCGDETGRCGYPPHGVYQALVRQDNQSGGSLRWSATKNGEPVPGGDCIAWIQEKKIGLLGADNIAVEHIVPVEEKWIKIHKIGLMPLHVAVLSMLGGPAAAGEAGGPLRGLCGRWGL